MVLCTFTAYLMWTSESRRWIHFCPQGPIKNNKIMILITSEAKRLRHMA